MAMRHQLMRGYSNRRLTAVAVLDAFLKHPPTGDDHRHLLLQCATELLTTDDPEDYGYRMRNLEVLLARAA